MNRSQIENWLRTDDPGRLEQLWAQADEVRRANVGDAVYLRGLIEFSNHCRRACEYCGLSTVAQRPLKRYRMSPSEILAAAGRAVRLGMGRWCCSRGRTRA